jgi:heterodisulfide reductase subunit B
MSYIYYAGCCCSFKASGKAYHESLLADFALLGVTHQDLKDWNCCGATMYMAIDQMQAFGMASRNLALAEAQAPDGNPEIITPCSACYVVLNKSKQFIKEYPEVGRPIMTALKEARLKYEGKVKIRHPLDVLVNDVGLAAIKEKVGQPFKGLKVASYYGCLMVRPYSSFDRPHDPQTMDLLMETLGAEPVEWPLKVRCCGGSMTGTVEEVGLRLSYILLNEAQRRGADVVATACPFCQTNLECFQQRIKKKSRGGLMDMPVTFFTQLLGVAMGIPETKLGLHRLFVPFRYEPKRRATGEAA